MPQPSINHLVATSSPVQEVSTSGFWNSDKATKRMKLLCVGGFLAVAATLSACGATPGTKPEAAVNVPVDSPRVAAAAGNTGEGISLRLAPDAERKIPVSLSQGFSQQVLDANAVDPQAPKGGSVETLHAVVTAEMRYAANTGSDSGPAVSPEADVLDNQITWNDLEYSILDQNADLAAANGFITTIQTNGLGVARAVAYAAPAHADDSGRSLVEQGAGQLLSLPFSLPNTPLKVGDSWTVDTRVAGNSNLLRTITYTVTAISDSSVDTEVIVTERPTVTVLNLAAPDGQVPPVGNEATDGEAPFAGAPGAATTDTAVEVLSSTTTMGKGHLQFAMDSWLPQGGTVEFTTRIVYGNQSSPVRVVQDYTTGLKFGE